MTGISIGTTAEGMTDGGCRRQQNQKPRRKTTVSAHPVNPMMATYVGDGAVQALVSQEDGAEISA
jgi:hypothetical protein